MALPRSSPQRTTSSPRSRVAGIIPYNYRDVIQKQVTMAAENAVDQLASFGVGGSDGRIQFPSELTMMRDPVGRLYHIVGVSSPDDTSVAGP